MSIFFVMVLMVGSMAEPDVCVYFPNDIEPDMRMRESDFSTAAAEEAAQRLAGAIRDGEIGGDLRMGALNRLKIIKGHVLLRMVVEDREAFGPDSVEARESVSAFCQWLGNEGFWFD